MVLGINRRNAVIARTNPRSSIRLVRDKVATKQRLMECGVPVPPTLAHFERIADVRAFNWANLPDAWVMKPQRGSKGRGVLVTTGRSSDARAWLHPSGRRVDIAEASQHAGQILDGEHSDAANDGVLIEPLLIAHDEMQPISPVGLPDVRVICLGSEPLMAMLRLPTVASGGRGNLHQGGIGAAIDMGTGTIRRAVHAGRDIGHHPDTGAALVGRVVPLWHEVLAAAASCGPATGLGYSGSDLVVDARLGVVVLEVNGHPGLEIQNVCGASLRTMLHRPGRSARSSRRTLP